MLGFDNIKIGGMYYKTYQAWNLGPKPFTFNMPSYSRAEAMDLTQIHFCLLTSGTWCQSATAPPIPEAPSDVNTSLEGSTYPR